jgi:hypothetical protein
MSTTLPNFDELVKLAQTDPEAFEQLRKNHVQGLIDSAPEHTQRRLKGLQFQVDMIRRRTKNPMGACLEISKMMYDSLYHLRETIQESETNTPFQVKSWDAESLQVQMQPESASVLSLCEKRKSLIDS